MRKTYKRQRYGGTKAALRRSAKRAARRRVPRTITPMMAANQIHSFTRFTTPLVINGSGVNPVVNNSSLALGAIPNVSEFTALYDQYRIVKCITKFYLRIDPGAQAASQAYVPRLFWYRDYDSDSPPSNLAEMRENARTKMRCLNPYKPVTIVSVPNTLSLIYYSALANGYKPSFKQWIDMTNPSITHYAYKWAIDNLSNTNYFVEVENQLVFQCKNAR